MVHISRPQGLSYAARGALHCYVVYVREGLTQRRVEVDVSDRRWRQWERGGTAGEDGVAAAVADEVARVGLQALRGVLYLDATPAQPPVPAHEAGREGYVTGA
ncbi:MAG TPA: hypothetical protein VD962_06050 [Rubricoccaceae bacterium]|nr:hypothetical protein [Rubricoccaceae bacterium]